MDLTKMERKIEDLVRRDTPPVELSIRLENTDIFFDPFDPSPADSKRLNPQIESYLVDAMRNVPFVKPVKIAIFAPECKEDCEIVHHVLENAIHRHFTIKTNDAIAYRAREMRRWRFSLIVGLLFLMACLGLSQLFLLFKDNPFMEFLSTSFGIVGWVALWEPATFILYGWRDVAEDLKYYIRLRNTPVEYIPEKKAKKSNIYKNIAGNLSSIRDKILRKTEKAEKFDKSEKLDKSDKRDKPARPGIPDLSGGKE